MKPARIFLFTILYVSLTFLYTSCVREDTGDCIQYVLDMQAVDSNGNDLTATGALQKAEVYLFDEKGFIRKIPADISSDLIFGDDKNKRLTLVVWGNIKEDTLIAPDIPIGTPIEEARLQLRYLVRILRLADIRSITSVRYSTCLLLVVALFTSFLQ